MEVWKQEKGQRPGSSKFKSRLQFGIRMLGGINRVGGDLLKRQGIGEGVGYLHL